MNIVEKTFEEAAELGERFPDISETEVIDHINFVCKRNYSYHWRDTMHKAIMAAFNAQDKNAGYDLLATYTGIDYRPSKR